MNISLALISSAVSFLYTIKEVTSFKEIVDGLQLITTIFIGFFAAKYAKDSNDINLQNKLPTVILRYDYVKKLFYVENISNTPAFNVSFESHTPLKEGQLQILEDSIDVLDPKDKYSILMSLNKTDTYTTACNFINIFSENDSIEINFIYHSYSGVKFTVKNIIKNQNKVLSFANVIDPNLRGYLLIDRKQISID